jgi:hypothetical protein
LLGYPLVIHFAGSDKRKIPLEYYKCLNVLNNANNGMLIHAVKYFMEPSLQCFLNRNSDDLRGGIDLQSFIYDGILDYFYEPSFIIITAYNIFLKMLLFTTGGHSLSDFLPRLFHALKAIEYHYIDWDNVKCLYKNGIEYESRLEILKTDIVKLYNTLHTDDMKKALDDVEALWLEKATWVCDEKVRRTQYVLSQL